MMLTNILFFYSRFLNLSDNIQNQYNMGFEGGDAPGGSLSRGSLEKFTQRHKIATGTLSCLSANILTN